MRRLRQLVPWLLLVFAAMLVLDSMLVTAKARRASKAVSKADGRMASIPTWPFGSEYRVKFYRPLVRGELEQLVILNALRGSVGIGFEDCELSEAQIQETVAALRDCYVFRIDNGQTLPLSRPDN